MCDDCLNVWLWHSGWWLCVRYYCGSILPCSLCYHRESGQHQLRKPERKHHIQACLQFVVGWCLACDLVVFLICLVMVGPYRMWAAAHIIMRWLVLTQSAACFMSIRHCDAVRGSRTEKVNCMMIKCSPNSPTCHQAKVLSKAISFSPDDILGYLWVLFNTTSHK